MPFNHLPRPARCRLLLLLVPLALGPGVAFATTADVMGAAPAAAAPGAAWLPGLSATGPMSASAELIPTVSAPAGGAQSSAPGGSVSVSNAVVSALAVSTSATSAAASSTPLNGAAVAASASDAQPVDAHRISDMLMKKFGVAKEKAQRISSAVMQSASKYSLPPALLLSIISIESRFKENARGGHGATGLMQVVPSAHRQLVRNIDLNEAEPNIDAGSAILHGYLQSARGDVKAALKSYGGSNAYAEKVTLQAQRFEPAVAVSEAAGNPFQELTLPADAAAPR